MLVVAMDTPHARLKAARLSAGYKSAKGAAEHFGFTVTTYSAHENGQNGLSRRVAKYYGACFNTTAEWLLFGTVQGVSPSDATVSVEIDPQLIEIWQQLNIRQRTRLLHIAKVILEE